MHCARPSDEVGQGSDFLRTDVMRGRVDDQLAGPAETKGRPPPQGLFSAIAPTLVAMRVSKTDCSMACLVARVVRVVNAASSPSHSEC